MPAVRHPDILQRGESAVFIVDVQERFRSHIAGFAEMAGAIRLLTLAAARLGIPVAFSEQYPQGLGHTVEEIASVLPEGAASFEKLEISSVAAQGWDDLPDSVRGARQLVIVGIEAHVCVRQTVLDAVAAGIEVHVPVDAVGSRGELDRDVALRSMELAGARPCTVESVLFDWLAVAGTAEFRDVQGLIRESDAAAVAAGSLRGVS